MAGRSEVLRSAAYAALSVGGKRVLHVVEEQAPHGAVGISLAQFMSQGMCRAAARFGIKQVELLGFVSVSMGPRRVNVFRLSDGWRGLDADEAKRRVAQARLPMPPRASSAPPKPVPQVEARVEPPRTMRRAPSLPTWQDVGR
jgi:hypothetical protein